MTELGSLLYVAFGILVYMFWRRVKGQSFNQILEAGNRSHHHVVRILKKHPRGGTWRDFQAWMKQGS